jgi:hypothetical protein
MPKLMLNRTQLENILGFLGYGNPSNSVWFVGLEEGFGGSTDEHAVKNLQVRGEFEEIMDLKQAHHFRLRDKGGLINFDVKPPSTPVWQWMAKIMLAYHGENWQEPPTAKEYVKSCLGRKGGDTFLTELSPIPARNKADEQWKKAFEILCCEYGIGLDRTIEKRKKRLIKLLQESHPAMIICYGNGVQKRGEFEKFFGIKWVNIGDGIARANNDRPHFLLPFFGVGQIKASVLEEMIKLRLMPSPNPS